MVQASLFFGLSEHPTDVDPVILGELAGGLSGSFLVEDPLYCVEHVAAVLRRGQIGQRAILVYQRDNLCHLGFRGLFGVLNLFDLFVALLGQTGQIVLKAYHAVVGGAVCSSLDAILFGHLPSLVFTLEKCVAKIIRRMALLSGERTGLCISQRVSEIGISSSYRFTIRLPVRKRHQILVTGPLISDKQRRPFSRREAGHLQSPWIAKVASSPARSDGSTSGLPCPFR